MTTEELRHMAVIIIAVKIKITLENPNSEESRKIAQSLEGKTGIPHLEIHRFHNAILNDNVVNSFTEKRAGEIAWSLCKSFLKYERVDDKLRGQLSTFANQQQVSFNAVLETFRTLFHEIIDESLAQQTKA